ncbi:trypco2 family protein [Streptomyces coeruleorubidus]|uniref:trypco2 family protein n=1 Tax=Streptomyces coeruleorubidus TaxID=116188 RepID=UPI0036F7D022
MDKGISLTEALAELRRELYEAQAAGAGEQFRFEVEQAEIALEVEFRRDGNGKVKAEVGFQGTKVGGEAGGGLGSTRRQLLTLRLQVHDEALGGTRAKIRRGAGGLDAPDHDLVRQEPEAKPLDSASDAAREGALQPWEM